MSAALVVGGTGGIGSEVVRLLVERGQHVTFTYRANAGAAAELTRATGATGVALDLSGDVDLAPLLDRAAQDQGELTSLVYAAGPHVPMRHLSTVDPAAMQAQLMGDAMAFYRLVHAALPALRRSRGSIVAVTTAATSRFAVRDGLSSVPKAAVEAAVRALAKEEGRFGVRVNAVGPGMLTDGMAERLVSSGELDERALEAARGNIPMRAFGQARDVAEAVCFLASPAASYITGQKLDVDGGYSA